MPGQSSFSFRAILSAAVAIMALAAFVVIVGTPADVADVASTQLAGSGSSSPFRVFNNIAGRDASTHYTAKVRKAGTSSWSPAMVLETVSTGNGKGCGGYFDHLDGWTQSWLSLEVNEVDEIEIMIQRISSPIESASLVPATTGAVVKSVSPDGVIVSLTTMAQVYLSVDGGMNDVDTGPDFTGEMHTMNIFANPMMEAPSGDNVMYIKPSDWDHGANPLATAPTTVNNVGRSSWE